LKNIPYKLYYLWNRRYFKEMGRDVRFLGFLKTVGKYHNYYAGDHCRIYPHVIFETSEEGKIIIEDHVGIGYFVTIKANHLVKIGRYSGLAGYITIWDRDGSSGIIIGENVFLGAGVRILHSVTIGDGAVIGANSLVDRDIPPFTVYGGIPARYIRDR